MEPAAPEKLLEAFQVLDPEGKGYVTKDFMTRIMLEEGEPFTNEELEEMMAVAVDSASNVIPYEYYLNQLMVILIILTILFLHFNQFVTILKQFKNVKHEPKPSIYDLADRTPKRPTKTRKIVTHLPTHKRFSVIAYKAESKLQSLLKQ